MRIADVHEIHQLDFTHETAIRNALNIGYVNFLERCSTRRRCAITFNNQKLMIVNCGHIANIGAARVELIQPIILSVRLGFNIKFVDTKVFSNRTIDSIVSSYRTFEQGIEFSAARVNRHTFKAARGTQVRHVRSEERVLRGSHLRSRRRRSGRNNVRRDHFSAQHFSAGIGFDQERPQLIAEP